MRKLKSDFTFSSLKQKGKWTPRSRMESSYTEHLCCVTGEPCWLVSEDLYSGIDTDVSMKVEALQPYSISLSRV